MKLLGRENARISSMCSNSPTTSGGRSSRGSTPATTAKRSQILADLEQDLSGRMQERMKAGLRTALDERTQSEISLRQCGQTLASTWTRSRQEGS